jgi:chromate reductase
LGEPPAAGQPSAQQAGPVVGASTGLFGAVWAQAEARKVLAALGAQVLDAELPVGMADSAFDGEGVLVDPELAERLRGHVEALAAEVPAAV